MGTPPEAHSSEGRGRKLTQAARPGQARPLPPPTSPVAAVTPRFQSCPRSGAGSGSARLQCLTSHRGPSCTGWSSAPLVRRVYETPSSLARWGMKGREAPREGQPFSPLIGSTHSRARCRGQGGVIS